MTRCENFANKIVNSAKKQKENNSELINSMKKVTRFTSFIIIPVGILLFIQAFFFRQNTINEAVVATAVALPGTITQGKIGLKNFKKMLDLELGLNYII